MISLWVKKQDPSRVNWSLDTARAGLAWTWAGACSPPPPLPPPPPMLILVVAYLLPLYHHILIQETKLGFRKIKIIDPTYGV